ncbi:uncharacterized protein TOT_040000177 [Theileria orientalis strain Shintoku]|uniref:WW domain-containing protein n=1 Tax=Theileria orientalis strain Shintoku TaxID=869250 RepID=J4DA64_THEOR|nr:uncharacterized protein TOT_040000177 [Theileria orientalis strain Shintoku]BAM41795.1 uncharacterized protein TOT_040000177 [Theileria orientalis strain Shintoku]|eukprot:XP_009692096.1 uncharacterized protein TOT_040000177 [Theileria orientalis strain Shintoku]
MTDYWVSTKKHYCEVCKCWVSGHLQNITRHESSIRHISTLRNKMMESHRRKTRKKKQDKFEEDEMKRLNTITLENPVPAENNSTVPFVNDLFAYRPLIQPTLDFEAEKKRIAKTINRTLAGYEEPEHVDLNYNPTRWIATIDQDDGSLVYYNNLTGIRTKTRPKDFDGVIPSTAAHLTTNWTLKFDPFKGRRYYHNINTGEIRWIDESITNEMPILQQYGTQGEIMRTQNKTDNGSYIHFNVKCELKMPEPQIQVKIQQNAKTDETEEDENKQEEKYEPPNNELNNISGPLIGQWEVVNPRESVFSHWVENTDIFVSPEQTHHLQGKSKVEIKGVEQMVGNDYQEDPIVSQSTEEDEKKVSNGELRKVLGSRPSKGQENKLNKLISYDSKYNFKEFNLKHVENLLNMDFVSLAPQEYIRIFKLFNKNMYFDERIYYSIYRSLYDKIPYFDFYELIKLMEYITPFAEYKGNMDEMEVDKVCTEIKDEILETESPYIVKYDYKRGELEKLQKDIVKEITNIIENRIKFNLNVERDKQFKINSTCLKSLNRLGFLSEWKVHMRLSEEIISYVLNKTSSGVKGDSEKLTLNQALESVNSVCDTISQKCIHTMCKKIKSNEHKIKLKNEWDLINFTVVDNVQLALRYYSKGDVQILKFIEDYSEEVEKCVFVDLKSEEICELNQVCNLCANLGVIYSRFVQCLSNSDIVGDLDSFLCVHYKILYASKFLKSIDDALLKNKSSMGDVYTQLRESSLTFFVEHKSRLSPKNQGILMSLICECNGGNIRGFDDDKEAGTAPKSKHEDDTVAVLRGVHFNLAKSGDFSMFDCLNVRSAAEMETL